MRLRSALREARRLFVALFSTALFAGPARADDPWEFWPELNLYKGLGPETRLFFLGSYSEGRESEYRMLDAGVFLDVTFEPFLRAHYIPDWHSDQDWRKKRYLWIRVGYDHLAKVSTASGTAAEPENRGILAVLFRVYFPAEILLETRLRVDFRWIGSEYSNRYRPRFELNRDFPLFGTVANVYVQAEFFYDTRYDGWARQLYQVGAEITLSNHFRIEPFVARQLDPLPSASGVYGAGVVARWFY